MAQHIYLDRPRCESFGFCEELAPEFFEVTEEGDLIVKRSEVPVQSTEDIQAAVRACPVAALRLDGSA